jgi:hypothetical protein
VGTYAGALGAAVVGNFGAEVVDTGGRARAGATILEGMKLLLRKILLNESKVEI